MQCGFQIGVEFAFGLGLGLSCRYQSTRAFSFLLVDRVLPLRHTLPMRLDIPTAPGGCTKFNPLIQQLDIMITSRSTHHMSRRCIHHSLIHLMRYPSPPPRELVLQQSLEPRSPGGCFVYLRKRRYPWKQQCLVMKILPKGWLNI